MLRQLIVAICSVAAFAAATLTIATTTNAQFVTGPYFYDPTPPRAGYYYPGVPFASPYGVPYYQGFGPPYYPGYGPPYTTNFGREYLLPPQTYVTPHTATSVYDGYYY
jgi:hypothetical protein